LEQQYRGRTGTYKGVLAWSKRGGTAGFSQVGEGSRIEKDERAAEAQL
jgi:hypothetical protein